MAVITPTISRPGSGIDTYTWANVTEADTCQYVSLNGLEPVACALQVYGTFGGATAITQVSNDASSWLGMDDIFGAPISRSLAGYDEISTAMVYMRPSASGGTSQSITWVLSVRG